MEATAKKLHVPTEKMVSTVDRHANTSAASIPLVAILCSVVLICASGTSVYIRPIGFSTVTVFVPFRDGEWEAWTKR